MAAGGRSDVEGDEHDGREPDVEDEDGADTEPRFGWNDEGGGARPLQPHGQPGAVMTAGAPMHGRELLAGDTTYEADRRRFQEIVEKLDPRDVPVLSAIMRSIGAPEPCRPLTAN